MTAPGDGESFVDTQVRLVLEEQGASLFRHLYVGALRRFDLTVLAVDFTDDKGRTGNVAFKTSLHRPALIEMVEALVSSFSGGPQRFAPRGMSPELLRLLGDTAKNFLPAGVGYALIVGDPVASAYVSNADREGIITLLQDELLPKWRRLSKVQAEACAHDWVHWQDETPSLRALEICTKCRATKPTEG